MRSFFQHKPFLAVAVIALVVRVAWFVGITLMNGEAGFFQTDTGLYSHFAKTMLDHGQFAYYHGELNEFYSVHSHTPGYPTFIYLFLATGTYHYGLILVQILLSVLTVILVVKLTDLLFNNKKAAFWAGLFVALDVPSIVFANLVMSETLFTTLVTGAVYLIISHIKKEQSWKKIATAGLLMGIAILCRPVGLYLPIGFVLALWFFKIESGKKTLGRIAVFGSCIAMVVSIWLIRNQNTFGEPFITTLDNTNLFYYRAAGVVARTDNISLIQARRKLESQYIDLYQKKYKDMPITLSRMLRNRALEIIADNPGTYAKIHITAAAELLVKPMRHPIQMQFGWADEEKTIWHWGSPNDASLWDQFVANASPFTMLMVFVQLALLLVLWLAFAVGTFKLWRRKDWLTLFLVLGMIGYFCIVAAGPETNARFRIPLLPFVVLVAGAGIVRLERS